MRYTSRLFSLLFVVVAALCLFIGNVQAQGPTPTPAPIPTSTPVLSAEAILSKAENAAESAANALGYFNTFLTWLQVLSIVIGLIGAVAAYSGYRSGREFREDLRSDQNKVRDLLTQASDALQKVESLKDEVNSARKEIEELRGQTARALTDVQEWIKSEPLKLSKQINQTAQALSLAQLAEQQIDVGNLRAAADTLKKARDLDPGNRVIRFFLGDIYVRMGQVEEAIEELIEAGAETLDYPSASASYAYALRVKGDKELNEAKRELCYAQAAKIFLDLFERYHDLLDISGESAYGALAGLFRRQGRIDEAIKYYEVAQKITPQNSYPVNNLALLHYLQGHRDEAIKYLKQSKRMASQKLESRPSDYWTWFDLITAELGYKEVTSNNLLRKLESAIEVTPGTEPLEKFLYGLRELEKSPNPPKDVQLVLKRLQQEIENRKSILKQDARESEAGAMG